MSKMVGRQSRLLGYTMFCCNPAMKPNALRMVARGASADQFIFSKSSKSSCDVRNVSSEHQISPEAAQQNARPRIVSLQL